MSFGHPRSPLRTPRTPRTPSFKPRHKIPFIAALLAVCLISISLIAVRTRYVWTLDSEFQISSIQHETYELAKEKNDQENFDTESYDAVSNGFVTVLEDVLPSQAYHEEPAVCQVGSKMYLMGGLGVSKEQAATMNASELSLGTKKVHILDLETLTVTTGPDLPQRSNHMACAAIGTTIHITGGFRQDSPPSVPLAKRSWTSHWDLDTTAVKPQWRRRAPMPEPRGGHGCTALQDGNMYCVGGGGGQWGPFHPDLFIYYPSNDTWEVGPPMQIGRDHVPVVPVYGGQRLFALGGRSDILRQSHSRPDSAYWQTMNVVEAYDPVNRSWAFSSGIPFMKAAPAVVPVPRPSSPEPNLLVLGGEVHLMASGLALRSVEEYDMARGTWYCHSPLPYPVFGAGAAVWGKKVYVVAGGDWFAVSPTLRLQVLDLERAPLPQPCAYEPRQIPDAWSRHFRKTRPWPEVDDDSSPTSSRLRSTIKSNSRAPNTTRPLSPPASAPQQH